METILHLLPLTGAQKAAFQAAAPESEHLFLPTNDRGGASSIPQEWRERTTILLGYVPPDQLKTFPNLKWVQSWNAGVDPYLVPGVLPDAKGKARRNVAAHFVPHHAGRGCNAEKVLDSIQRTGSNAPGSIFQRAAHSTNAVD